MLFTTSVRRTYRIHVPSVATPAARIWDRRTDRYSELRSKATLDLPKVEMSYIGG